MANDVPMPTYFRFLTLLAFKIFIDEQVSLWCIPTILLSRFCNQIFIITIIFPKCIVLKKVIEMFYFRHCLFKIGFEF